MSLNSISFQNKEVTYKMAVAEFSKSETIPVNYTWYSPDWSIESRVKKIALFIFSIIIFPIALYKLFQNLAGRFILIGTFAPHFVLDNLRVESIKKLSNTFLPKRINVKVCMKDNEFEVDGAAILSRAPGANKKRWVLLSGGNGECYERVLYSLIRGYSEFKPFLNDLGANILVYNYPGVGRSGGGVDRQAMIKAYQAMLKFLEDDKEGVGADEIIGFGHSLGGGVQGEALKDHTFKKGVKYVFINSKTFSKLSIAVSKLLVRPLGFLVKFFGWELDTLSGSKQLTHPEIVIQSANVPKDSYCQIKKEDLGGDEIIHPEATLAHALLSEPGQDPRKKVIYGILEEHNDRVGQPQFLAREVERKLYSHQPRMKDEG